MEVNLYAHQLSEPVGLEEFNSCCWCIHFEKCGNIENVKATCSEHQDDVDKIISYLKIRRQK